MNKKVYVLIKNSLCYVNKMPFESILDVWMFSSGQVNVKELNFSNFKTSCLDVSFTGL